MDKIMIWLGRGWLGLLIAYILSISFIYGGLWWFMEPIGLPDQSEKIPEILKWRWFFHVSLTIILAPHIVLILEVIRRYYKFHQAIPIDSRLDALSELGIVRVYKTSIEDNDYFINKLSTAKKIRVLAINAEMLVRNMAHVIKDLLEKGATLEVLMATKDSELVKEMEQMEINDGRDINDRSIPRCIDESELQLQALLNDVNNNIRKIDRDSIGKVFVGHFNTQYRETMIIIDDNWVWWTPHLNPARGSERPTFVAEGNNLKFVTLCRRHYLAVKQMSIVKQLSANS